MELAQSTQVYYETQQKQPPKDRVKPTNDEKVAEPLPSSSFVICPIILPAATRLRRFLLAVGRNDGRRFAADNRVRGGELLAQLFHQLRMLFEVIAGLFTALAELHLAVAEPGAGARDNLASAARSKTSPS